MNDSDNKYSNSEKGIEGEDFVNNIAYQSFMKYWCYPNPKDITGDKKEICDLIIYFKDILILICVKNYAFNGKYDRYIKKTIEKDIKQLLGAERKIKQSCRDIVIKHPDKEDVNSLKIDIISKVYRITVHLGNNVQFYPASSTKKDVFINVFDKDAFNEIVKELDTLPDFIEYLDKREQLFKGANVFVMPKIHDSPFEESDQNQFLEYLRIDDPMHIKHIIIQGKEADLMADYLWNDRSFSTKLKNNSSNVLCVDFEGKYNRMHQRVEVKNKYSADKTSYFIDNLVKHKLLNNKYGIDLALELMSYSRFKRRSIADMIIDFIRKNNKQTGYVIPRRFAMFDDIGIALIFCTPQISENKKALNFMLDLAFNSYIIHNKYSMKKMILIGFTKKAGQFFFSFSEDIKKFSKEDETKIMTAIEPFNWFKSEQMSHVSDMEYPD